ncbi:MAG: 16S rRNA (guanine(966)-N(2))-methyltransferase RsmD [Eubacterium aggregans]|uniref:16S rRNA (Guanine(966)-N(2))-methyltransferase RsmD n=1 Tax=Eubacterium aggregans TaxID=81409 RepID=A0A1H4CVE6_9FIRM|nr:16S rRNA (guanine(966)-N(2))-methyltransferase RsmD [Eubacterium aggregans]MDD4692107.1 16S rRNA (guanine(966)-N(2))-methyltransferase RsmD [Eubacterium aggregans]MEA5074090.1 16S rRNA (guanine(966)-N(2))-methyltransferase RsmD [Eubacterium aggregans]SEA64102.1 16S rRNA (guanine(966)-N(2))-methyltransferase RsmD [Eubacterium aggregans]
MRVIAGEKRGMRLYEPGDERIRPTTDKIKGAIFNTIQMRLDGESIFVDLFGGSGAMGIEALSRGAREAWFFDVDTESIRLIEKNVEKAGFGNRARIGRMSAKAGIDRLAQGGVSCDFVFMDPPYVKGEESIALIEAMANKKILKSEGIIMMEHEKSVIMPLTICNFVKTKEKKYGNTVISYYGEE